MSTFRSRFLSMLRDTTLFPEQQSVLQDTSTYIRKSTYCHTRHYDRIIQWHLNAVDDPTIAGWLGISEQRVRAVRQEGWRILDRLLGHKYLDLISEGTDTALAQASEQLRVLSTTELEDLSHEFDPFFLAKFRAHAQKPASAKSITDYPREVQLLLKYSSSRLESELAECDPEGIATVLSVLSGKTHDVVNYKALRTLLSIEGN